MASWRRLAHTQILVVREQNDWKEQSLISPSFRCVVRQSSLFSYVYNYHVISPLSPLIVLNNVDIGSSHLSSQSLM